MTTTKRDPAGTEASRAATANPSASSPVSTSAQALVPVMRAELRPLKSTLAELDDDDITAIGRVVGGWSPARVRKLVGVGVGTLAGMGLCAISPVGGLAVIAGVAALVVVGGRADMRSDLIELGLSPALTEALLQQATLQNTARKELANPWVFQLAWRDQARLREIGASVVAAARHHQDAAGADHAGEDPETR